MDLRSTPSLSACRMARLILSSIHITEGLSWMYAHPSPKWHDPLLHGLWKCSHIIKLLRCFSLTMKLILPDILTLYLSASPPIRSVELYCSGSTSCPTTDLIFGSSRRCAW